MLLRPPSHIGPISGVWAAPASFQVSRHLGNHPLPVGYHLVREHSLSVQRTLSHSFPTYSRRARPPERPLSDSLTRSHRSDSAPGSSRVHNCKLTVLPIRAFMVRAYATMDYFPSIGLFSRHIYWVVSPSHIDARKPKRLYDYVL